MDGFWARAGISQQRHPLLLFPFNNLFSPVNCALCAAPLHSACANQRAIMARQMTAAGPKCGAPEASMLTLNGMACWGCSHFTAGHWYRSGRALH